MFLLFNFELLKLIIGVHEVREQGVEENIWTEEG
jgi:hypothetical protein